LPDGYSLLESYTPETELDKKAYEAIKNYIAKNNESVWSYYLSTSKLNVATAIYEFKVKHSSEYTKKPYVKSYLSGTFYYNVKGQKVSFERESQLNKLINKD